MYLRTELEECIILADYCRYNNLPFCHINNEVYTKSWKQKNKIATMGSAKGFPDYLIIVNNQLIAIEMKRIKNSKVSPAQEYWLKLLNNANVPAKVCYGAKEAIEFIKSFT